MRLLEIPRITNRQELETHLKPLYVMEDYMKSEDDYDLFRETMYNIIKGCFEIEECRTHMVSFKFYLKDKESHTLQLRHFITNVILWAPFVELTGIKVLDESFILDCSNINTDTLTDYVNQKIISVFRSFNIKNTVLNLSISEALYNLRRISIDFSLILGLSIYAENILDLYNKNPRFADIMTTTFDHTMQPHEIEEKLDELMKEEIGIFKSEKHNPIGIILRAGSGIKHKQLSEFTINGGMKPDLSGNTIPIPINSNTMIRGLDKPSSLYIDALGARKSLIMNKKVMGRAGYFGKIVLLLARTLSLSRIVTDCNTKHFITVSVRNKKALRKLDNRYYKLSPNDEFKLLKAENDTHLVGKKIILRSPVTCELHNEVCHKCYGFNSVLNFDIADGVSAYGSEEITKVVNQMVLSAKHLLTTISEKIEFNEEFDDFFTIDAGEISPNIDANESITNPDDYAIYINPADMDKVEDFDDDGLYNTFITNGTFYVRNLKTKQDVMMREVKGKELYLTNECIQLMKKGSGLIKFKDTDDNTSLFVIEIMNNELTKPLYDIIDLLNKNKSKETERTIDEHVQRMLDLLLESGIEASCLQGELILNRLVRSAFDIYERPDFTGKRMPDYKIITVAKALEHNKSPLIGMAYQDLKRQLLSDETYDKRTEPSYLDPLFRKTSRIKEF